MNRSSFFTHYLLNLAILWDYADFYFGEVTAPFLGLPLVMLGRILYAISPDFFYGSAFLFKIFVFIITFVGLKVIPLERSSRLLLPKIWGFMLALFWVKIRVINMVLMGIIYNFLYKMIWQAFINKDLVNQWFREPLGLNLFWERFLLLFLVALSSGISTNICYYFLKLFSLTL